MPTTWEERVKPITSWDGRLKPQTDWDGRVRPITSWDGRLKPQTDWDGRVRPITYMTPLEDAYTEVADENDEVIYIYADSGREMPLTEWTTRPAI